jgi:hypothetical protein
MPVADGGVVVVAVLVALHVLVARTAADTPTLAQMDAYVAQRSVEDLSIMQALRRTAKEVWVSPDASAAGTGTKLSSSTLINALTSRSLVAPGTIVWLKAGVYDIGSRMVINQTITGTRQKPVLFRAEQATTDAWGPPTHVTTNGTLTSTRGSDHIWWWGVEVTGTLGGGSGVTTPLGGDEAHFVNLGKVNTYNFIFL